MRQVNIAEAKAHLSELVRQAVNGGEVVIALKGQPQVRLMPIAPPRKRTPGLNQAALLYMAGDFDAPLEDFAEYME